MNKHDNCRLCHVILTNSLRYLSSIGLYPENVVFALVTLSNFE